MQEAMLNDQCTIVRMSEWYFLCGDTLYWRLYDEILLLSMAQGHARQLMEEVHGGECGPHMNG